MAQPQPLDFDTLEAAASWYVSLREEGPDSHLLQAHQQWLAMDPRHVQAWEKLGRLQGKLGKVTPAVARSALASAQAQRREVLKVLTLLLGAGGVTAVGWRTTALPDLFADQRTATGEHRKVRLQDGGELYLNTASAVNIRYGNSLREVHLLHGEILVQTASDSLGRPFVVPSARTLPWRVWTTKGQRTRAGDSLQRS